MTWIIVPAVLVVLAAVVAYVEFSRNREVVTGIKVVNPDGVEGKALVVYHPGKSDFQRQVFSGFADGLASNGWRVAMTTPSRETPTDLTGYDLLVLGGPTYGFSPARPIKRYLSRLGDLAGLRTVTIITGLGAAERSSADIQKRVRDANGTLVKALLLYKARPNDESQQLDATQNRALAVEMATRAAIEVSGSSA